MKPTDGIRCPRCKKANVSDCKGTEQEDGFTRRRRRCECGCLFYTREHLEVDESKPTISPERLEEYRRFAVQVQDSLTSAVSGIEVLKNISRVEA